jgi:N-glycosylase/DNA lyase
MTMLIPMEEPFSLYHTLSCGQAFRWQKRGEWFSGVVGKSVILARESESGLEVSTTAAPGFVEEYFRHDDNFNAILCELRKDRVVNRAMNMFFGLRLLRQEPWECVVSYVCSIASNIPKITNTIETMAERFGERMDYEGEAFFSFPNVDSLAHARVRDLEKCGLGFRARYVSLLAKIVEKERIDLTSLRGYGYEEAREKLMALPGVGEKVADCVCLFSLDKLEAFPIDRWMRRIMVEEYLHCKVSDARVRKYAKERFGKYAGYAQEYLFTYARALRFK